MTAAMIATLTASTTPTLSVVIPVRNSPSQLAECLRRLQGSDYSDYEIIVVDDASNDDTAAAARTAGVQLICLETNLGPAGARNRGAETARGEYLLFLDADVLVHPGTLRCIVSRFQADPEVDALFGSYDLMPRALNIVSQYRNLLHHFTHQVADPRATTFWAGCGAVRRSVFLEHGGFDESFERPCVEDIELGMRLHKARRKIVLDRDIQVTHLKRWTFWGMVKTDYRDRALPWTELLLADGKTPDDLNLKRSQRVSTVLAFALTAVLAYSAWKINALLILLPAILISGMLLLDYWSYSRRVPTWLRILAVAITLGGAAGMTWYMKWWALAPIGLMAGIVALNFQFYQFFAREKQPLFAVLVFPLHVLYYLYSGAGFAVGTARHWRRRIFGGRAETKPAT